MGIPKSVLAAQRRTEEELIRCQAIVREQARLLKLTASINEALGRKASLRSVLQACAEAVVQQLDAAVARVWTLNQQENVLELQASAGLYTHINGPYGRIRVGTFKIGRIAQTREPQLTNSVLDDPQVSDRHWAKREGLVSFAGYPLMVDDRVMGVMAMFGRAPLGQDTLDSLATIADDIASGIERAKRPAEALAASEAQYRNLLDNASEAIQIVRADGSFIFVNHAWYEILGFSPEDVSSLNVLALIPPAEREKTQQLLEKIFAGTRLERSELHAITKNGQVIDIEGSASQIMIEGQTAVFMIFWSIMERKEVDRRMAAFYSLIAHELRSPLTSICGALGLMAGGRAGDISEKAKQLVQISLASVERLMRLISDILDMQRIETGKLELKLATCSVEQLIKTAIEGLCTMADEAGVTLTLTSSVPIQVRADGDQIVQVLSNLISNSISFSPKGEAVVVSHQMVNRDTVRISVRDSGPGIPDDQIRKLFGKFQQLDQSSRNSTIGAGLGLAISKALVEEHGGRIGVESTIGSGSNFWFELPVADQENAAAPT